MFPTTHTDSIRIDLLFGKRGSDICQAAISGKKVCLPHGVRLTYSIFTKTFFATGLKDDILVYKLGPDTTEKVAAMKAFANLDLNGKFY